MNQISNDNNFNDVEQIKIFQPGASIENKNIIAANDFFFVYCTTVSAIIIEKSTNRIKNILNKNNNKFIKCIALNNNFQLAIFYDLEIFLYDINNEKIISSIEAENVIKMEFNKEKKLLFLTSKGEIFYINNNNNEKIQMKTKNFCLDFQFNPFNANNFAYANNKNEIFYINILEKKELSYYKIQSDEKEDENMKISCLKFYDLDEEFNYILIGTTTSLILLVDLSEKSTLINKFERFGSNEIENLFWLNFEPGTFISINKNSGKFLLWNVSKISYNKICKLNDFPIFNSVKFNENSILFSNEKGDINVFNFLNQKIEYKIENSHCQSIFDVKFNKFIQNYFASCSFDSTIKIWDLNLNKCVITLFATNTKTSNEIKKIHFICLKWSPLDKNLIASGDSEKTIRIFNIENKKEICNFICNENQKEKNIQGIDWNINNTLISSCGNFVFFLLFKENSLTKTHFIDCFSNVFRIIFDTSNENQIIIPTFEGKIKFYNYKKNQFTKEFSGHKQKVYAIELNKNKNFLASSSDDLKIGIWNINSTNSNFLMGHTDNIRQLLWLENNILLSGSWDKTIRIWNINEMICVNIIKEHQSDVYGLDANYEYLNLIVSCSRDNTIRLWNYKKLSLKNLVEFDKNNNEKNVFDKCFDLCKKFYYEDGIFEFWNVLKNKNFFEEKYYENKCNLKKEIKNIKESKQLNFYLKKQTKIKELILECAKFGLWEDYCNLNILIENWEDAIISAPNVSVNYWKFLVNEYTKFCKNKNNENLLFSSLISNNKEISIEELIKRKEFEEAKLVWVSRLNKNDENFNENFNFNNENENFNENFEKILFNDENIKNIYYKDCINNLILGNPLLCCKNFLILNDLNNAIKCLIQTNQNEIAYLLMKTTNNFLYNNEIINSIFENKKNSSSNEDLKELINSSNNSINKLLLSYKINPPIPIGKLLEINKNEEFFNLILENNKKEIINIFMKESENLINNLYENEKIDEENLIKIYKLLEIIKNFIKFEEIDKNEFSRLILIVLIIECFNNNYKSLCCLIIEFLLSNKFLIENVFDKKSIDFIYNFIQFEKNNNNNNEYLINEDKIKFLSQFLNDSNKIFNIKEIKTNIKNFKKNENKKFLCDDEIKKFYFIKSEQFPTNSINNNLSSFSGKIIKNHYIKLQSGNFACLSEFLELSKFLNIK